jgi:carboxypeptidase C (cathepsin A)
MTLSSRTTVLLLFFCFVLSVFAQVPPTKKSVLPSDLPFYVGTNRNLQMYTGYLKVRDQDNGHLFYWFIPTSTPNAPLVLWLNGGPGCTSMFGVFQESGPFRLVSRTRLEDNPDSWHRGANMLFIDSPVGYYFSFSHFF